MERLLIVTWYGLRDSLERGAAALGQLDYEVLEYPLFRYMFDANDRVVDWKERFLAYLRAERPRIILWWYYDVDGAEMLEIRAATPWAVHVLFNWDDPFKWQIQGEQQRARSPAWDLVFTCCSSSVPWYESAGAGEAHTLYPGTEIAEPRDMDAPPEFDCDVSMLVTNLYQGEQYGRQVLQRRDLIDAIAREPSIKFHLYGPEELAVLYPNHYQGFVSYARQGDVFRRSRINVSTHVVGDTEGYLNERVSLVLGAGGCLLVDPVAGVHEALGEREPHGGDKCYILDTEQPVEQILTLLQWANAEPRDYVAFCNRAADWAREHLSYQQWALTIHRAVGAHLLDTDWYNSTYGYAFPDRAAALQHWHAEGCCSGRVPYYQEVPTSFRAASFLADTAELDEDGFPEAAEARRAQLWIAYNRAGRPKAWLYCPELGLRRTSADSAPVLSIVDEALVNLHPLDLANLNVLCQRIRGSRPGDADLPLLLNDLASAAHNAGGEHVDMQAVVRWSNGLAGKNI